MRRSFQALAVLVVALLACGNAYAQTYEQRYVDDPDPKRLFHDFRDVLVFPAEYGLPHMVAVRAHFSGFGTTYSTLCDPGLPPCGLYLRLYVDSDANPLTGDAGAEYEISYDADTSTPSRCALFRWTGTAWVDTHIGKFYSDVDWFPCRMAPPYWDFRFDKRDLGIGKQFNFYWRYDFIEWGTGNAMRSWTADRAPNSGFWTYQLPPDPYADPPDPDDDPVDLRPTTRITSGPARTTRSRRATFRFTSNERSVAYRCKLDRGPWRTCGSPRTYARLRVGRHTFQVRAVDIEAQPDLTPAVRRWQIRP